MGSMHISRVGHLPFRKFPDMGRVFMDAFAWETYPTFLGCLQAYLGKMVPLLSLFCKLQALHF